jgi:hypothetical protein
MVQKYDHLYHPIERGLKLVYLPDRLLPKIARLPPILSLKTMDFSEFFVSHFAFYIEWV